MSQPQTCKLCARRFRGSRHDARLAGWEPCSSATQHAIDFGPIVCPDCVKALIDDVVAAARDYGRRTVSK